MKYIQLVLFVLILSVFVFGQYIDRAYPCEDATCEDKCPDGSCDDEDKGYYVTTWPDSHEWLKANGWLKKGDGDAQKH